MSFSEYTGNKAKVSQTVGRIFKNTQNNFLKIQTSQSIGTIFKTGSGSKTGCEHERLSKPVSAPSSLTSSKFGFQKFRFREKKRSSNHRAELLDNQETGDNEEFSDETEFQSQLQPLPDTALIGPSSASFPVMQKQKRWPF